MRAKRVIMLGVMSLWAFLPDAWSPLGRAQERELAEPQEPHAVMEESNGAVDPQTPHDPLREEGSRVVSEEHPQRSENTTPIQVQMEEHSHSQRPALLPPDEDKAYSEFNHHIAGVLVLLAGGLALLAAVGGSRYAWARPAWPSVFFLLGIFLLIRHDPESWPWGPLTFWESVTDAQVLQHVQFSFIVLGIGVIEWLRYRGILTHSAWGWIFPSLAVAAALMLFMYKPGAGPVAEKIYRHHVIMAVSGIIAMIAKVFDDARLFNNRVSSYLWTTLIMFVGLMLLIYTE